MTASLDKRLRRCHDSAVRLPSLDRSIGIVGIASLVVVAAAADLLMIAGGVYLLGAHYTARGRVLVALGLWPVVGLLIGAILRFCVRRQRRLVRVAVVVALVGQTVAVVAALASSL